MQKSTLEITLNRLRGNLEDVRTLTGKPCRIYVAYKDHILSSGIHDLESLSHMVPAAQQDTVNDLLVQFRNEQQIIFNQ